MRRVRAALAWGLLAVCGAAQSQHALVDPRVAVAADGEMRHGKPGTGTDTYLEAYLPIRFASSHSPSLLALPNGDLLCFWSSGTWEGESGFGVVMSRLPHGSKTWSTVTVVDSREGESYQNPTAFETRDGAIHLFHTAQAAGSGQETSRILEMVSHNRGDTWTGPTAAVVTPGAYSGHVPLTLSDGTWLLPVSFQTGTGAAAKTSAAMMQSGDQGKSWMRVDIPHTEGKMQPSLIQGRYGFTAYLRSQDSSFIFRSSSTNGRTWTPARATALPNNNASVEAFKLHNGDLVIAFDNSNQLRKPLAIALSQDDGITWRFVRNIEVGRDGFGEAEQRPKVPGREEYSFPSITQAKDGTIYVAFNYRRQTIKVVAFREQWIRQGGSSGVYRTNPAR